MVESKGKSWDRPPILYLALGTSILGLQDLMSQTHGRTNVKILGILRYILIPKVIKQIKLLLKTIDIMTSSGLLMFALNLYTNRNNTTNKLRAPVCTQRQDQWWRHRRCLSIQFTCWDAWSSRSQLMQEDRKQCSPTNVLVEVEGSSHAGARSIVKQSYKSVHHQEIVVQKQVRNCAELLYLKT
jgi:hypothetical protein